MAVTFRGVSTIFVLLLSFLYFGGSAAAAQTITLPVTIDYSLLRTMIADRAFPENDHSATLVDEGGGCIRLVLSDLQVAERNGMIRLETQVFVRAGTPLAGNCYTPLEWRGYLVLYQQPLVSPTNWQLSFSTISSELLGTDRQPARIAGLLWRLIESRVFSYLDGITIDLTPPVTNLKDFLLPLFPADVQEQTRKMLASVRPGEVRVQPDSVHFDILADVEAVYDHDDTYLFEQLEGEALEKMVALWENWDGLLSYLVATLSRQLLTEQERQILIDVLLDTRYQFVAGLADKTITHDFVREQFVSAWQQLSPIFKNHLYGDASSSQALGYLAFVSSADALLVFDRLGPTFGLEISRNGLVRLAQMLSADQSLLFYRSGINPDLQKLFRLVPDKATPKPSVNPPDGNLQIPGKPYSWFFDLISPSAAVAAQPTFKEILQWKVPNTGFAEYIEKVKKLLDVSTSAILKKSRLSNALQPMFRSLIPAMAWQESCFRQFVVKENKLTYLLSYNQSSVGLMQVNERVWRGVYERESLRWDINYNADAGCEIAALYLQKYALRDKQLAEKMDDNTLARLVYAMYNGGPSQYKKFLNRLQTGKFYKSDELFWEKYNWVSSGRMDKAGGCFIGS